MFSQITSVSGLTVGVWSQNWDGVRALGGKISLNEAEQRMCGGWGNFGSIFTRLWTKVYEVLRRYRRSLVLNSQRPCPIVYVTFRSEDIHH